MSVHSGYDDGNGSGTLWLFGTATFKIDFKSILEQLNLFSNVLGASIFSVRALHYNEHTLVSSHESRTDFIPCRLNRVGRVRARASELAATLSKNFQASTEKKNTTV